MSTHIFIICKLSHADSCNAIRGKILEASGGVAPSFDAQSIIGLIVTFVVVLFSCIRTSSSSQIGKLGLGQSASAATESTILTDSKSSAPKEDDIEENRSGKNCHQLGIFYF